MKMSRHLMKADKYAKNKYMIILIINFNNIFSRN